MFNTTEYKLFALKLLQEQRPVWQDRNPTGGEYAAAARMLYPRVHMTANTPLLKAAIRAVFPQR